MKNQRLFAFAVLFFCAGLLSAQLPAPPSSLSGSSLRNWFKTNWHGNYHNQLGYTNARRKMYNFIDNKGNKIEDVYSGYQRSWWYGGSGTNPQPINCEHTIPQSFFGSSEPMRSDLHHLFPVHSSTNSSRGNHPFGEIDDNQTTKWWRNGSSQTSKPSSSVIDDYSEYKYGMFEPRESQKGNTARAVFYFFTMYPTQAGSISSVGDLNTLYQWHLQDPVDSEEMARNDKIESYQGDRNPYIDYPHLVAAAWGFSSGPSSSQLFISEYVEGSSYNKAIEIVNLTGSTVNLSSYSLKKQTNGSGSWNSGLSLSGSLSDGEVYVVANSSASSSLRSRADLLTGSTSVTFNGNDPVGLFYNNTLIDIVGNYNGGSSYFASNVTLRRKSSITDPSTSYSAGDWDSYSSNTFSDVGSYGSAKAILTASSQDLHSPTAFPNPFQDRLTVEIPEELTGAHSIQLVDLTGRILKQQAIAAGETLDFETSQFPSGVYLLRILHGGQVWTQKVVKR